MTSDTPELQAILRRLETLEIENRRLKRTGPLRRPHGILALGAVVLFVSGAAVGQKARTSKFGKYRQAAYISNMDWLLMQAQVDVIREMVPTGTGIDAPSIYFDSKTDKVGAIALVDGKYLESQSAKSVRDNLEMSAARAWASVQHFIPDVAREDLEIEFRAFNFGDKSKRNEPGKDYYIFAGYKNRELIMH